MTQISERYRTLADEMTRRVAAVPADRWDDPSPCEGWSARDVLGHVIGNHRELPGQAATGSSETDRFRSTVTPA